MFNRIIKGILSAFYGQGVTLLFQFISVPLFISAWGMEYYGQWLAIFAIPMTLTMLDFGFFNIIGNKISKYIVGNSYRDANNVINVVLKYISSIFFLLFTFYFLMNIFYNSKNSSIYYILFIYSFFVLLTNFIVSIFRANLEFHIGSFLSNTARFFESVFVLVSLFFDANMIVVSFTYLVSRFVMFAFIVVKLHTNLTWYKFKFEKNRTIDINDIRDSLNYALLPISFILNNQGSIFLINAIWGSAQVAIFVTIRTYFRLLNQFISSLTNATWQEINYLYNLKQYLNLKKLMSKVIFIVFIASIVIGCFLLFNINPILSIWTHGKISSTLDINSLILLSVILFSCWQPFHIFLSSVGKHKSHAKRYFFLQSIMLIFSFLFVTDFVVFLLFTCIVELTMLISTILIYKKNSYVF
ncbi:lipopolysaccharide biosynthesis protein [Photobacterium damselae]|uniref:lipopolysaccharide biosynthesis protein n=1 Tax=Photobacterium damselae TaxID=38293 RepID=UPI004068D1A2